MNAVEAEQEAMREKYADMADTLTDDRLEELVAFALDALIEHVQAIEYLDLIEEAQASAFDATERELEFVHDFLRSHTLAAGLKEALT